MPASPRTSGTKRRAKYLHKTEMHQLYFTCVVILASPVLLVHRFGLTKWL